MAYKKFDDPADNVAQSPRKLYDAVAHESVRRAIQSITNRILDGNFGTAGTTAAARAAAMASGCGTGGTGGVCIGAALAVIINGRAGTRSSAGSLWLPAGTQAANTFVKYGIFGGFGSSGTCLAGNEGASATAAYLPDCPDGLICFGYMQYATTNGQAWNRGANVCSGSSASAGTASFVDLVHMPLFET